MIAPVHREIVAIWNEMGEVPDDQPTRAFAARLCADLLADAEATRRWVVDELGKDAPDNAIADPAQLTLPIGA